ncbi:hypothetical protein FBU30_011227 [Linnemannia zychae]|nr:hypothetical protein FBU30_011227 [Linnemannia zychae]
MPGAMFRLPPFGPLLNTADAITHVLSEAKNQTDISVDFKNDKAFKERIKALDDGIKTILVPELDKYKSLDKQSLLEGAFKIKLFTIQDELGSNTEKLTRAIFQCLDLLLRCSELELVDQLTPNHLLEEVLDLQTVECGEQVYYYLESRVEYFASGISKSKGKGLSFLRICNELLRRILKSKNTVLCGRILMLMSSVFPITERSGVNLKGDFNTDNVTLIESEDVMVVPELASTPSQSQKGDESHAQAGEPMDVDEESNTTKEQKEEEIARIQSQFYTDFWSLQSFFNNPHLLINSPDNMTKLREGIDKTLAKFAAIEEEEQKSRGQRTETSNTTTETPTAELIGNDLITNQSTEKKRYSSSKEKANPPGTYFPKFLTSPKLLQLEIADPYFRKHILVQFLIVVQYLQSHNLAAREAQSKIATPNRPFLSQWILDTNDQEWAEATRPKILKHLKVTGNETGDSSFVSTVEEVLKDDESWVQWKAEGCQPFERQSWTTEQIEQSNQKRRKLSQKMAPLKQRLGCATLTTLWREVEEQGLEDTDFGSYRPPRDIEMYLTEVSVKRKRESVLGSRARNGNEPTPNEEEEMKEKEKGRLWRALRLGAGQYMHLYDNLKLDIDGLAKAINKDKEFEDMVRENGGKVPEPPAAEEAANKTDQVVEGAGSQEQAEASDETKIADGENSTLEDKDKDKKEPNAGSETDNITDTIKADDPPQIVSIPPTPIATTDVEDEDEKAVGTDADDDVVMISEPASNQPSS